MSVATKNPFALLDDEASRPASPTPAPPKDSASPAAASSTRGNAKSRGGPASRGGKYYQRGGKPSSKDSGNLNQNGVDDAPAEGQKKFEGRGRGGRGGRGSRGGFSGRGRQFDKHSQTGKTDSDKKIHQSWGGDDGNAELKNEEAAKEDAAAEIPAAGEWGSSGDADAWGASPDTGVAATGDDTAAAPAADDDRGDRRPRREREPEEEDNTLTLDQYLAQQKEKELSSVPKLEGVRKVEENWKDVVPIQKDEDASYFVGKSKATPKARTKKDEKVFIEIDARFERPSRGGPRGRGGDRRGGSSRGGRGGARGGRPSNNTNLNVDDETAFPSLG